MQRQEGETSQARQQEERAHNAHPKILDSLEKPGRGKRKQLSGSENRKRKRMRELKIEQEQEKLPKLTQFFKPRDNPELNPDPENCPLPMPDAALPPGPAPADAPLPSTAAVSTSIVGAMGDGADRAQCCMLCSNQLYSAGFNVYQARTYHGEKSFFDKLIQLTNYTSSLPQLSSDSLCSVCATLLSQIDQLEFQLSHLVSQIRSLFHKMVQAQTQAAAARQPPPPPQPQPQPQSGLSSAPSVPAERPTVSAPASAYPSVADVKTEPQPTEPPRDDVFFAKKISKENGGPAPVASESVRRPSWPAAPGSSGSGEDSMFNLGHFLDPSSSSSTPAPAPAAASTVAASTVSTGAVSLAGDFTDKFVREVAAEDVYRFQCVLCSRLADSAETIRQHVRGDHPGADRIAFPWAPVRVGSGKRGGGAGRGAKTPGDASGGAGAAGSTGPKVPRSITASAASMAHNIAERLYVCAGCDKPFGCEAFLTRHVAAQHCGRMFGCQYCGKEFSRSDKKVRHERSHTGERPYSCTFCGKAFSRRDKCTTHERSHTKHRPLECQRCGELMFTTAAYDTHRARCQDDAQGTGPLWQTQAGQAAVHAQNSAAAAVQISAEPTDA